MPVINIFINGGRNPGFILIQEIKIPVHLMCRKLIGNMDKLPHIRIIITVIREYVSERMQIFPDPIPLPLFFEGKWPVLISITSA